MIVHVCSECLPEALASFDGPADERECIVCGCAKICREVNPADAIRGMLPTAHPSPATPPAPAPAAPPGLPPLTPPVPPAPPAPAPAPVVSQ